MDSELARSFVITSCTVQGTVLVLFGLLLRALVRSRHLEDLRWWANSWFALAIFHLGFAVVLYRGEVGHGPAAAVNSLIIQASGWVHLALFAGGTLQFFRKRIHPGKAIVALGAAVAIGSLIVLATVGGEPWDVLFLRTAPRAFVGTLVFLGTALALARARPSRPSVADWVFFVFVGLYGLEQAHYVVALTRSWLGSIPAGYLALMNEIDLVLQVGMGLGMVMMVTERLRRQSQRNAEAVMKAEEELRQAHRIEAVTTLAGGIAHDYNNILTAIVGYTDLIDDDLPEQSAAKRDLDSIRSAVHRASILTQELLAFCRRQTLKPERLQVGGSLEAMRRSIGRSLGDDIVLELEPGADGVEILVDPAHLELLIVNLAINAKEAMPDGGRFTVRTFLEDVVEDSVAPGFRMQPGPAVVLEVSDTGRGMDEATRSRIFEPYFTTKGEPQAPEDGLVPGMGLAACYGFVRQSGGDVVVRSREDEGTTFRIYFPVPAEGRQVPRRPRRSAGNETILLVEDEEPVRETVVRSLRRRGYEVLVAENGVDALMLAEGTHERIDLLVTDVVMPRMSGQALSRALQAVQEDVRTLFVSGYTPEELHERGIWVPGRLITKPFTGDELANEVREILDGEALEGIGAHSNGERTGPGGHEGVG